jgi:hypothetical protein
MNGSRRKQYVELARDVLGSIDLDTTSPSAFIIGRTPSQRNSNMKKLLIAVMIVLTQVGGAWAQVPKKCQGNWVTIIDNDDKLLEKNGAGTIDFGLRPKETITKVEPAD